PLAVAFMRLPTLWMGRAAGTMPAEVFDREYRAAYRRGLAAVDVLLVLLVGWLARRLFPAEPPGEWAARLVFYLTGTAALGLLLYDRLDLVQALLVLGSLGLLVSRAHYAWSFAVLAAAVNFKLVPLVLAPVWVVGSLPTGRPLAPWPEAALRILARAALLAGM